MTTLSDKDIQWLNALADDELGNEDKQIWLKRIEENEEVMNAYEDILVVKQNLQSLSLSKTSWGPCCEQAVPESQKFIL